MYWLYNILLVLAAPIWVPWMWLRAKRRQDQVDWGQRAGDYGFFLPKGQPRIWLHAVSVGEVMAALPIIKELYDQDDKVEVVLSTTTSSGYRTAMDKAGEYVDHILYFPIDVPRFAMNAIVRVKPTAVAMMETELWMNFLTFAKSFGATTFILNGRISDRSFPRAQKASFFYKAVLAEVDHALMQSETDRERIVALGAKNAEVVGNTKFDEASQLTASDPAAWREKLGIPAEAKVVVIGSTRGKEEHLWALSLAAVPEWADYWIVHAPRHLEDCDDLAVAAQSQLGQVARRSLGQSGRYLILDTYGELGEVYGVADVAIVGGSFLVKGGQNILQPIAHGVPVVSGPNLQNFRDVAALAERAGALLVTEPGGVGALVVELMNQPERRAKIATQAKELVASQRGASAHYAKVLIESAKKGAEAHPKAKPPVK